jgi:hypothetical protein
MKSGSARHSVEERPSKATTSKKVFLNANGSILIRTIVDMVIISNGHAKSQAEPSTAAISNLTTGRRHYRVPSEKSV